MGIVRKILNNLLKPIEYSALSVIKNKYWYPPIFIIGSPRSSSTLFYQSVVSCFDVCYMSNFMENFYSVPVTGWILQSLLFHKGYYSNFKSECGRTSGCLGPSEAAEFWYQWFPRALHVYVGKGEMNESRKKGIRDKIISLSKISGKPLVFKNLYNSMRINPLMEAIPESIFVICRRNPVFIAQSILLIRSKKLDNIGQWWSVPPKEIDELLNMDPIKQVVRQIYLIYKQIEQDLKKNSIERTFYVDYDKLCDNPAKILNNFRDWLSSYKIPLKQRKEFPKKFANFDRVRIDKETFNRIVEEVNLLWKK